MKIQTISVMVCKKVSKDFHSWTVSHGVTAELTEGEDHQEALRTLRKQLAHLVNEGLNGKNNTTIITR